MQFSRLSILSILFVAVSAAAVDPEMVARDNIAQAGAEIAKRSPTFKYLDRREPKTKKVKGSSGDDEDDQDPNDNSTSIATSVHMNVGLAAGAGVIALGVVLL